MRRDCPDSYDLVFVLVESQIPLLYKGKAVRNKVMILSSEREIQNIKSSPARTLKHTY